jgi:SAM-dependent methyltransferase
MNIAYIISDIHIAVFFEQTALRLRERGVELSWILINSEDSELAHFLEARRFQVAYPEAQFQEINTFYEQTECYDVIFVSNVFEHLTNPVEVLHKLTRRLHPNGILVVDGPVENNFTLAGAFRKALFGLRKKMGKVVHHIPTHIFYSNAENQKAFFEQSGLSTLSYQLVEGAWPFPSQWHMAKGLKAICFYLIAQISQTLGMCFPKSGNVFYYVGRK